MDIKSLLSKGYFPKELPPCFTTEDFANKAENVFRDFSSVTINKRNYYHSKLIKISIPKVGLIRKKLGIPNPYHFYRLCDFLVLNKNDIFQHVSKSDYSCSRPIEPVGKVRCLESTCSYSQFFETFVSKSVGNSYIVKTDISQYYASIYTHSISWAYHTKLEAKRNLQAGLKGLGDYLDSQIRSCNENQSIGLPIGPDTSLLISEVLATRLDIEIKDKFPDIEGCRWIDDYYFSTKDLSTAQKLFKFIQEKLNDFGLEINERKSHVLTLPHCFESDWVLKLKNYEIYEIKEIGFEFSSVAHQKQECLKQRKSIWTYFNLVTRLHYEFPNENIYEYALRKIFKLKIELENWELCEDLLLHAFKCEPTIAQSFFYIILAHEAIMNKDKINDVLKEIVLNNLKIGKSFEVVWSLWGMIKLGHSFNHEFTQKIYNEGDSLARTIILAYHIEISTDDSVLDIFPDYNTNNFFDEDWLFAYQIYKLKGLATANSPGLEFFDLLLRDNISFVDLNKNLDIDIKYPDFNFMY